MGEESTPASVCLSAWMREFWVYVKDQPEGMGATIAETRFVDWDAARAFARAEAERLCVPFVDLTVPDEHGWSAISPPGIGLFPEELS